MKNFDFGVAVSAYQIEGAPSYLGKLPSIWDTFSHTEGKIRGGTNGDVAIDFIKRYKEDIKTIKELGVDSFRLSLSWPRIMKEDNTPNNEGIRLYIEIIDEIIKNGLKPVVTLYHWDLPQYLEDKGGWLNDEISDYFNNYVDIITKALGNRVKEYITINEPQCIVNCGYSYGTHAPGKHYEIEKLIHIVHNVLLAHAKAYHTIKKNVPNAIASIAGCSTIAVPVAQKDLEEAKTKYFDLNDNDCYNVSIYLDPIFLGDYPKKYYELFKGKIDFIKPGDMELIKDTSDICYQNIYSGYYVGDNADSIKIDEGDLYWMKIVPSALYYGPKFLYERYHKPIIISENGLTIPDHLVDNKVEDTKRIKFIEEYFANLMKAKDDGVDVRGYYYWSIFDNFEWGEGYESRFGLVYVDFKTQKRYKKNSYFFYRDLINKYRGE